MSTLYVNNIEPVSGSSLTLISASLVAVDNLTVTSLTSSFQGDLQGTASFATTASHALNSTAPGGVEGQVQFNSGSSFGADANLFWDDTNKRLGVGTSTPTSSLHIKGADTSAQTNSILIQNSLGQELFRVHNQFNNGQVVFSSSKIGQMDVGGNLINNNIGNIKINIPNRGLMVTGDFSEPPSSTKLCVKGDGSTSTTTALLVQNSSGTDMFKVSDDGKTIFVGNGHDLNTDTFRLQSQNAQSTYMNVGSSSGYINCQQFRFFNTAVAVGSTANPQSSVVLQADSTTKGFLPPRMTTTQKNAISSPAAGLQVYDSTLHRASLYASSSWENIITETSGSPNSISNIWSGTQAQYDALTPDNTTLYFIV